MNELDWKQPALIGGVAAGLLSVIPGLSLANCCFCAWLLVGGAIAAKLLIDRTSRPIKNGEGAQVGAIAGVIAAGLYLIISVALIVLGIGQELQQNLLSRMAEMSGNPDFQEMMQRVIEASANQTPVQRLFAALPGLIMFSVLFIGFSTLGGLLGVALFEKRRDQPPPPPYPPSYPPNYPPNYPPQSGGPGGDQGGWPSS
ncbi:MAG: hypothetical protein AB7U82_11110 [Blastocatellales bacterium]